MNESENWKPTHILVRRILGASFYTFKLKSCWKQLLIASSGENFVQIIKRKEIF